MSLPLPDWIRMTPGDLRTVGNNPDTGATRRRSLFVVADDFGIGPETSRGILDLARRDRISATVMLVNSPHAQHAIDAWNAAKRPLEVGWHPCLTLDRPLLPREQVASLVDRHGAFLSLGQFLLRSRIGRIDPEQVRRELHAQLARFIQLTGATPRLVNFHHHLHVFAPVDRILLQILSELNVRPYLRRVVESMDTLLRIPGGRLKRFFLAWNGRHAGATLATDGWPTNDSLAGISTPASVLDAQYLTRWLRQIRGNVVELTCHPGHRDETLIGRDCVAGDGRVEARVAEFNHLCSSQFLGACKEARLSVVRLPEILAHQPRSLGYAA
jgi:predicted glycoside hydrolase/deacetylase ChbG (UPF0249 family)